MNRREKFAAASFILCGEIRNRIHTHTYNEQTISSEPCLSACADNKDDDDDDDNDDDDTLLV